MAIVGAHTGSGELTSVDRYVELEHLYDTAPFGLCLLDCDLRFIRVNERLAAIHGLPVAEHPGCTLRELIPDLAPMIEPILGRVIETGEPVLDLEVRGESPAAPGVERSWMVSYNPLLGPDGRVRAISVVVRDVTDLKRAEDALRTVSAELERRVLERTEQLQRAREDLLHVNRVHTVDELAGGLAHELNQPLAAIVNHAGAALATLESANVNGELHDDLTRIIDQADRAAAIIRRVRMFVRKECPIRVPLDVNALVYDIMPLVSVEARRAAVEVVHDLAPATPLVAADGVQIQQVILNLACNGIESMASHGGGGRLSIRTAVAADVVVVEVQDTGPGCTAEQAARLFEPFFTTRTRGLGLGLPIARTIVETHGGRLDHAGGEEAGATFRFTLPAMPEGDEYVH